MSEIPFNRFELKVRTEAKPTKRSANPTPRAILRLAENGTLRLVSPKPRAKEEARLVLRSSQSEEGRA